MRRLFSTFAPGWPGAGLLLMRAVVGAALVIHGIAKLQAEMPIQTTMLGALGIAIGVLLFAGLWTPIAGSLAAALALWHGVSLPGDPWACIFLAAIGVGLALLGPGVWSIDSRLFGWKQIDVRDRPS